MLPETVQIAGVEVLNVIALPELGVALVAVTLAVAPTLSAGAVPKLMV